MGNAYYRLGQLDKAIAAYSKAIELAPTYALAHYNLGLALRDQGKFADALAALKKGHKLGSKRPDWNYPSGRLLAECERLLDLDTRLPIILQGKAKPKKKRPELRGGLDWNW